VGDAILRGPLLHAGSHSIGHGTVQTGTVVHHVDHLLIHVLGQVLVHFFAVENLASEIRGGSLRWCFYVEGLLLEGLTDNLKS